jgi:DNA-binding NarL/FixJ family response regulator
MPELRRIDKKHGFRLLIVSRRVLLRDGLAGLFENRGNVRVAATGAVRRSRSRRVRSPEVMLIDVAEPGLTVEEAVRRICALRPGVPAVALDERFLPAHLREAVQAGASGYWTVADSFELLAEALERVAAGDNAFSPSAEPYISCQGKSVQYDPPAEGSAINRITQRQMDVLLLLARGLSVKQCAEELGLAPPTVDNHKARLMKRLGVRKVTDLVRVAFQEGLAIP